jgi:micrococcal nuclease
MSNLSDGLYWYLATCTRVVDGDTLDLMIDLGLSTHRKERVRLYGIDTPEVYGVKKESEEYARGKAASDRTKELVEGKTIWVRTIRDKKGKYGRYLAEVYIDEDNCLNDVLVKEGLAEKKDY